MQEHRLRGADTTFSRACGLASDHKTWGWTWEIRHRQGHLKGTGLQSVTMGRGEGQRDQEATMKEIEKEKSNSSRRSIWGFHRLRLASAFLSVFTSNLTRPEM